MVIQEVFLLGIDIRMSTQGYVSNGDFSGKKTTIVLFINGRPVDCAPLKRALEATYAAFLPKAAKPFLFLARCSMLAAH